MKKLLLLPLVFCLSACLDFDADLDSPTYEAPKASKPMYDESEYIQPDVQPITVRDGDYIGYDFADYITYCEKGGCRVADSYRAVESVKKYVWTLMQINVGEKVLVCDSDSKSKMCRRPLTYKLSTGAVTVPVKIASASVVDVKCFKCPTATSVYLDYDMNINEKAPTCSLAENVLTNLQDQAILLLNQGASCRFGLQTKANFALAHRIDYVDVDKGVLGAYYEVSVTGQATATSKGYAIIKFKYTSPEHREIYKEPCSPLNPCEGTKGSL